MATQHEASPIEVMLTISEIAVRLRVTERTISTWVRTGRFLAPIKVGRGARWNRADVDAWLASHAADGRAAE